VGESPLGGLLGSAVREAFAPVAGYLALVTRNNPYGSADELLKRPDTNAELLAALDQARLSAMELVQQAWYDAGAPASADAKLADLMDDINRIFVGLVHLRGLVRHAHASVLPRVFIPGTSVPGSNPGTEAAAERADAVRDAVLGWSRQAALRARMSLSMAEGAGHAAGVLADALAREDAGERLFKRWRAHPDNPTCCFWCRRLHGVTIGLRESFAPYLGGPVLMVPSSPRRVATPAGARRFSQAEGSLIFTRPPRLYRGGLQGPLLHPFCRCRLEVTRELHRAHGGFLAASEVRDLPEDEYQTRLAFLKAAAHELGQVLKRLSEG
jgi:hypothetical protein